MQKRETVTQEGEGVPQSEYLRDEDWQRGVKDRIVVQFYAGMVQTAVAVAWRPSARGVPREQIRGDSLIKLRDGSVVGVEEKIVRWPGYRYTAIVLETMSCSVPGRERLGWMATARYDWLMHVRVDRAECSADCDLFDFRNLKIWFDAQDQRRWRLTESKQVNRTQCRIVPLHEIRSAIRHSTFTLPAGNYEQTWSLLAAKTEGQA